MQEVIKGILLPVVDFVRLRGYPCPDLFDVASVDEVTFRASRRRIDWDDYVRIYERLAEEVGGPDALGEVIGQMVTPGLDWMLRNSTNPELLLRVWSVLAPSLYGHLKIEVSRTGPQEIELRLGVPPHAAPSDLYFRACVPVLRTWVRRLQPDARVSALAIQPRAATLRVEEVPVERSRLSQVTRLPMELFAELSDVGADLLATTRQLFDVRSRLEAVDQTLAAIQTLGTRLPRVCGLGAQAPAEQVLATVPGLVGLRAWRLLDNGDSESCFEVGAEAGGWQGADVLRGGKVIGRVEASPPNLHGLPTASLIAPWLALAWQANPSSLAPSRAGALFIVRPDGTLQWTNGAARAWLLSTPDGERRVRDALTGRDPLFDVQPLGDPPSPCVVALIDDARDLVERVTAATAAWSLTPTQTEVLEALVRGLSNKEIAAELGNAEATVESHVTRILRKAGVTGRTALVSRFWTGAWT